MVSLEQVHATNALASTTLASGLVAVFAGATSGIGSTALLAFAKHATRPRIYFIGRSDDAAQELIKQMKESNPEGEYIFIKKDLSLLKNVDEVCTEILSKERTLNLLFMSQGGVILGDTGEDLPYITALAFYSRMRMLINFLPLLRRAQHLRRVVTVLSGTFEGKLYTEDISGRETPLRDARGHITSATTLALEAFARQAPEVSFIQDYPGAVDTNFIRRESGWYMLILKWFWRFKFRNVWVGYEECGERHVYLAVSGRYAAAEGGDNGILDSGSEKMKGTDGVVGSGVYTVGAACESGDDKVVRILEEHRNNGHVDLVWKHLENEFRRIAGSTRVEV